MLVLGMVLVCFAVAGLAVDVTRAALLRRTLQSAADAAVEVGASQIDAAHYYAAGGRSHALDADAARAAAAVALASRREVETVRLGATRRGVTVVVGGRTRTAFLRLIGIGHLRVTAEAAGEPVHGES